MFTNQKHNDWVQWLPLAQFAYNNAKQETTGLSPFYATYGQNPEVLFQSNISNGLEKANQAATSLKGLHLQLRQNIQQAASSMKARYDKGSRDAPNWKRGNKVYIRKLRVKA